MLKTEFIKKLLSRFNFYAQNDPEGTLYDTYTRVLTSKVDYDKLWDKFCKEYDKQTPPTGVFIRQMAQSCLKQYAPSGDWISVKVFHPLYNCVLNDGFPAGTTYEQAIKAYENKFKCTGFKIIEMY